ncbi:hypothetical protein [uncultured Clostridium sp.]|uniref:hypothetical protein n=1 Tax=uncultured Clostridium sp. TaxID=59620 RepID=UPI002634225E|nr:hypothetical protein [uncultured Clostridium sp.]
MRVNFNVKETMLKKDLRKENEIILKKIILGEKYHGKDSLIQNMISVGIFIFSIFIFYISIGIYNKEKIIFIALGVLISAIGVICSFKYRDKFLVDYIERERFKTIRHRNKDILLATGNDKKESFSVYGILEVKDEFIEITFDKIKKVYGIDSLKNVIVENENVVLEFKTIKYFIDRNMFREEEIDELKNLIKLKREKAPYEIREKIIEEINFKKYILGEKTEINPIEFEANIKKEMKKERLVVKEISCLGLIIVLLGMSGLKSDFFRVGIFLILFFIITPIIIASEDIKISGLNNVKEKNKFMSNLNLRNMKIYLGELRAYIFIGDDITVINREDLDIIRKEESIQIRLFNEKVFEFVEEKNGKVLLELNKKMELEEYLEKGKRDANSKFKELYSNSKVKKLAIIYITALLVLGKTSVKGFIGAVFIIIGYSIFYINGMRQKKKIDKGFKDIQKVYGKNEEEIEVNIKIYKEKIIIQKNMEYLRSIYPIDAIEIGEKKIIFGDNLEIDKEKFSEEELKILKNLEKENTILDRNKEINIQGRYLSEVKESIGKIFRKIIINLVRGTFLVGVILSIGIGISIERAMGIGVCIGIFLMYIILMKSIKSEYLENINSDIEMFIWKNKLYIEDEKKLEEYDLKRLMIEEEGENLIIRDEKNKLLLINGNDEIRKHLWRMQWEA